jgi:hypothetical protein
MTDRFLRFIKPEDSYCGEKDIYGYACRLAMAGEGGGVCWKKQRGYMLKTASGNWFIHLMRLRSCGLNYDAVYVWRITEPETGYALFDIPHIPERIRGAGIVRHIKNILSLLDKAKIDWLKKDSPKQLIGRRRKNE